MALNFFKISKGLSLDAQSTAPTGPANGDMYYDSSYGSFALRNNGAWLNFASKGSVTSAASLTSANFTALITQNSLVRVTGSTAGDIHGFAGGSDAKVMYLYNGSTQTQTVKHQSLTEATAGNRIIVPGGADTTLLAGYTAVFFFDLTQSRWVFQRTNLGGSIVNSDIAAGAAIDFSKLAPLVSGNILVGNVSNVATSVAMSGDILISNTGATTYNGIVPLSKGGTNKNMTVTQGGLVWTDSDSMEVSAAGTASDWALSGGTGAPTFSSTTTTAKMIDGSADVIQLRIQGDASQTVNVLTLENSSGTAVHGFSPTGSIVSTSAGLPSVNLRKANTSIDSPAVVATTNNLGEYRFMGYDGTSYVTSSFIRGVVSGTVATGDVPGSMQFFTKPSAGASARRLSITPDGQISAETVIASTSTTTGTIVTAGGMGVAGAVNIGGNLTASTSLIFSNANPFIGTNTTDGTDNGSTSIVGGSALSSNRGAYLRVHGNEHATDPGTAYVVGGATATNLFQVLNSGGTNRFNVDSNGATIIGTAGAGATQSHVINGASLTVRDTAQQNTFSFSGGVSNLTLARAANPPAYNLQRANGTLSSPTVIINGQSMGTFRGYGYSAAQAAYVISSTIDFVTDGEWDTAGSTTDTPGAILFSTTANATTGATTKMTLAGNGNLTVTGTTNQFGSPSTTPTGVTSFSGNLYANQTGTADTERRIILSANTYNSTNGLTRTTSLTGGQIELSARDANTNAAIIFRTNILADSATTSPTLIGYANANGSWNFGASGSTQAHTFNGDLTLLGSSSGSNQLSMASSVGSLQIDMNTTSTADKSATIRMRKSQTGLTGDWYMGLGVNSNDPNWSVFDNLNARFNIIARKSDGYVSFPVGINLGSTSGAFNYYDTGNYSATVVGYGSPPTVTIRWVRIGKTVTLTVPAFTGTSNSTSLTLSLPSNLQPGAYGTDQQFVVRGATDNGTLTRPALALISNSGTVIDLRTNLGGNTWTASGTKASEGFQMTYNLA